MNLVFFGIEPHLQAPDLFGVLSTEHEMKWVQLKDIIDALHRGDEVHIRQTTPEEKARIGTLLALYDVGAEIAARVGHVLDQPAAENLTQLAEKEHG
jgi:hypothetical protein